MSDIITFSTKPQGNDPWDVAIIGSGPAGLTAGIYTTRGAASTIIFAGDNWGGQLMLTTTVDNYPGFPEGIQGPDLMQKMRSQVERFGAEIIDNNVAGVDFEKNPFEIAAGDKVYKALAVIIATGSITKWLGVPGEEKLRGRGVSSCAPCDAPFFKDKKVFVVGGGDSAMEEATVLTKYAKSVTMIHRRDAFKASAAMQKKVTENGKIDFLWNTEIKEFIGEGKLEKIKIFNNVENKESILDAEGVFVAIGHIPATDVFSGKIKTDEKGYVVVDKASQTEIKEGVFVAGDVHDYSYKQAITAAGFGCMAAMDALKHLDKNVPNW